MMFNRNLSSWALIVVPTVIVSICAGEPASQPAGVDLQLYRLKMPDGRGDIRQASGIHYGRLGRHEGLWLVCDRNSGPCGNRIFFIDKQRLAKAGHGESVVAGESIMIEPPTEGWDGFAKRHSTISKNILSELRRQIEKGGNRTGPMLDIEDITMGPGGTGGSEKHIFVVAEQPDSLVLELRLEERNRQPVAVLTNCYVYDEGESARGDDNNDGLEGIAWSGRDGEFYVVEEGTRPHTSTYTLLYFLAPRILRCNLKDGKVIIDRPWSDKVTSLLQKLRQRNMQTLNAVTLLDKRTLLAVDRNGGWILAVDLQSQKVYRWLGLYDPKILNLGQRLSNFPGKRYMPYISIEGIARDNQGNLWMVDDPAMPEAFSESCLIRFANPPPLPYGSK